MHGPAANVAHTSSASFTTEVTEQTLFVKEQIFESDRRVLPLFLRAVPLNNIQDGASHCAKILTCFYDNLDVSDPTDPEVTIQIDVANAFNSINRGLTLDVLNGRAL